MFILSYLGALLAYTVSIQSGILSIDMLTVALTCLIGALVGAIVEAVTVGPIKHFHNFTVPFSSAIAMYAFSLLHQSVSSLSCKSLIFPSNSISSVAR